MVRPRGGAAGVSCPPHLLYAPRCSVCRNGSGCTVSYERVSYAPVVLVRALSPSASRSTSTRAARPALLVARRALTLRLRTCSVGFDSITRQIENKLLKRGFQVNAFDSRLVSVADCSLTLCLAVQCHRRRSVDLLEMLKNAASTAARLPEGYAALRPRCAQPP